MPLPETDVERVREFCRSRVPEDEREHIRVEMEAERGAVTIFECQPPWRPDFGPEWTRQPVARLRFTQQTAAWTLYRPDGDSRFSLYDLIGPTTSIDALLNEIGSDPTGIFWG